MIAKYIEEAAPSIQPAVVESRVSGLIGGVKVSGYVDLLDTEGRLIDSKSSTKPIKGIAHDHRLQLTSYAMITPAASGACRLDTVTKGKTVTLIQKSFCVSEKATSEPVPFINHRFEPAKPWEVSQTHARTAVKQRQDRRWKAKEYLADCSNGGHPKRPEPQINSAGTTGGPTEFSAKCKE